MGLWSDGIKREIKGLQAEVANKCVERAILLFDKVVDYSPLQDDAIYPGVYATGLFANSWYPAINEFDGTVGTIADESASGSRARIAALRFKGAFLGQDDYISLANNLSYADRVEYLGWNLTGPYAPVRNGLTFVKGVTFK